ncbi:TraB/GumN family protein [Pseudoxanthomonas helianthi]|uniref:TraB/GumN family protein n=1 Tax=Pseudoxanthomonas helianthi TaxID=1453541 RepID=A0A941AX11_9GAMM|nr:TraB/GumN family protein [Pseudoxanthomonas helianthi]MBP3985817.1 TraB/GumN family protein [Pseudoxanthomonas helianthi]
MKPLRSARRISAALLAAFLCVAHAMAADAPATPAAPKPPVPLLWKVSDADNSVYLLGSFHLLKTDDYPLPKETQAAFADSESLLFELSPDALTAPDVAGKFATAAGYADGRNLQQVLPAATYAALDKLAASSGGVAGAMQAQEPWFITLAISIGIAQRLGFRPELGLDQHLMQRAAEANKPTAGLETIDAQLAALDSTPMQEQVAGLKEFVDDPKKSVADMMELHRQWRAGDVAGLNRTMREEMIAKTPQTYRLIDVARNEAWLPKIEARLSGSKSGDTLVVVGALHLLGPDGLVEKLRAKGYKVERICSTCK